MRPCKTLAPQFDPAALEPRLRFAKLDTEAAPKVARRFQIRAISTIILLSGGREIAPRSGHFEQS
jgi:thioredoxin 2